MKAIFLGGDLRQKYACEYLNIYNIPSEFYEDFENRLEDKIKNASIVALPIPILKDEMRLNTNVKGYINIREILELINKDSMVFGGKFNDYIKNYLSAKNIKFIDYFEIDAFQIQNALLTAEGAIYYVKDKLERSISSLNIAIFGFGKISKILAYLLHSQGAKISIYARKDSDIAWCKLIGLNAVKIEIWGNKTAIKPTNDNYDIIFNTIPYRIMDDNFAKLQNKSTIIIDLSSYPFGIDEGIVEKYNLNYHRELGIPGRYAPKSAGEIIGKTILNNIGVNE